MVFLPWITLNSHLYAVTLRGSAGVRKASYLKRNLFKILTCTSTEGSTDTQRDGFYGGPAALVHRDKRSDILVIAGDFNAQVDKNKSTRRFLRWVLLLTGSVSRK